MALRKGDAAGALRLYASVPRSSTEFSKARAELGHYYRRGKDFKKAEAYFLEARRADPKSYLAAHGIAQLLQDQGRWEDAIRAWKETLGLREDFPEAHYSLAVCLREAGRREEARESCRRALELSPGNLRVQQLLLQLDGP